MKERHKSDLNFNFRYLRSKKYSDLDLLPYIKRLLISLSTYANTYLTY